MNSNKKLLFGKTLLLAFCATTGLTILLVYLTGLPSHRSIIENTVISLSTLSIFLFLFLSTCLYLGLDVLDNYSHKLKLVWQRSKKKDSGNWIDITPSFDAPDLDEGFLGIVLGIVIWFLFTLALTLLLFLLSAFLWAGFILLVIAIYWVFIRALKVIFSKSPTCENNLIKSMGFALTYTFLYVGWIYGMVYIAALFQ